MKLVKPVIATLVLAGATAIVAPTTQSAQKTSVLVVFRDDAPLEELSFAAVADARASQRPEAWGYVSRGVVGAAQELERAHGFRAKDVYSHALRGLSADLTAAQIQALRANPWVASIERDQIFHTQVQSLPWGINRVDADVSSTRAGNGSGAVTNVSIFVVDTGVGVHADINRVNHLNFTGDGNNNDCNGHGTHVAGTIAARDNTSDVVGIVPGAPVTGVKVLGCTGSGSTTNIVKGIDWVIANGARPGVLNLSLGGGVSTALDNAVRRAASAGFVVALAAGNSGANACNSSPARAGAGTNNGIITTAATDSANREAGFSNFGSCVDIWAPGVGIPSTRLGGGTVSFSGTSMASPHVAGVAALLRSRNSGSPSSIEASLKTNALGFGTSSKDGRAIRIANARNY